MAIKNLLLIAGFLTSSKMLSENTFKEFAQACEAVVFNEEPKNVTAPQSVVEEKTSTVIAEEEYFADHGLVIITNVNVTEQSEHDPMINALRDILQEHQVCFLTTRSLLHATLSKNKKLEGVEHFRYFSFFDTAFGSSYFVLGVPDNLLSCLTKIESSFDVKLSDKKPITPLELKLGFIVGRFREILNENQQPLFCNFNNKEVQKNEQIIEALLSAVYPYVQLIKFFEEQGTLLSTIFVPLSEYEKYNNNVNNQKQKILAPKWILWFYGHGQPSTVNYDGSLLKENAQLLANNANEEAIKKYPFIKESGSIAGINTPDFAHMISDLSKIIDVRFIGISSCYGGGINAGELLREVATGVIPPYPFIMAFATLTGDSTTRMPDYAHSFNQFFYNLFSVKIKKIDIPELLKNSSEKSIFLYEKEVYQPLYEKISESMFKVINKDAFVALGFKPQGANYIIEVPQEGVKRIGKVELDYALQHDNKIVIPKDVKSLLFYNNNNPISIELAADADPFFISAIPGDTFHKIKQIKKLTSDNAYVSVGYLLKKFMLADKMSSTKLIQIDDVGKVFLPDDTKIETCMLRILRNSSDMPDKIECLITDTDQVKNYFVTIRNIWGGMHWFDEDFKGSIRIISQDEALQWINKFDEKIIFFKKLANNQAPYRFLKDAVIETLPW